MTNDELCKNFLSNVLEKFIYQPVPNVEKSYAVVVDSICVAILKLYPGSIYGYLSILHSFAESFEYKIPESDNARIVEIVPDTDLLGHYMHGFSVN